MAAEVRIFGIRHHGPGCARTLSQTLEAWEPDCLLLEGPPEGEALFAFAGEGMEPPVAMMIYAQDNPRQAVFYPYASFSPEWQAAQYAVRKGIALRCMDLPLAHHFALEKAWAEEDRAAAERLAEEAAEEHEVLCAGEAGKAGEADSCAEGEEETGPQQADDASEAALWTDPFQKLGQLAGYEDGEAWWSALVEERLDGTELFEAVAFMMRELRGRSPRPEGRRASVEALREAAMRTCLRRAQKEGYQKIAVVCGAWHVPALESMPPAKDDAALLKGLPKEKVEATWSIWSYANLAVEDGYAAGVPSPAWYEFLWHYGTTPDRTARWLHRAANLLRQEGLDCSPAHLIESVRLAEGLAGLRGRSLPGLDELYEGLRATVCMGNDMRLKLIRRKLFVGEATGALPPEAPAAPLQRDIAREGKRLRVPFSAEEKILVLDLRKPLDAERSAFLHRLDLLEIGFGALDEARGRGAGTFKEAWRICWSPDVALAVVQASRKGKDIPQALATLLTERAAEAGPAELARLFEKTLLVNLPDLLPPLLQALETRAAQSGDCLQLLQAIPPLAGVLRYGGVRQFDAGMVRDVLSGMVPRALLALPWACSGIQIELARTLGQAVVKVHAALRLLEEEGHFETWLDTLLQLVGRQSAHPFLRGLFVRLLIDARRMDAPAVERELSRALSRGEDAAHSADWLTGFLEDNTLILLHDAVLWQVVDSWLLGLSEDAFLHVMPLLRRVFSEAPQAERRSLGERAEQASQEAARQTPEGVSPQPASGLQEGQKAAAQMQELQTASGLIAPLIRRILGLQEVAR
ncbi:MAG TPA: hypothetical protein IAB01_01290 [Candidatus Avidesulfovibrio excrementigallinarum]|nr:hypothetical protein [Candidatus Avidesulfovibrio excrementigallinarum]